MKTVSALILSALALAAVPASAAERRVTVVNATGHTMLRLFALPSGATGAAEDLLGDTVLKPNQSALLTIAGGGEACAFDLKGSFDDGATHTRAKVDVCATRTYRFTAG